MFRIGVTQWTLDRRGVDTVARAAELGFHALQLDAGGWSGWPDPLDAMLQAAYLAAARAHRVSLAAIGVNLTNEHPLHAPAGTAEAERALSGLLAAIDAAQAMKIPLVYVPSFNASEITNDEQLAATAQALRHAAEYGEVRGVQVASENTLGLEPQLQLLELAHHPNLKIFIDTQNPTLWGHDVSALITGLADHLCAQLHLKDGTGGAMGNAPLGRGEAELARTAAAIRDLGRKLLLVSENEYGEDAEARVREDLATLEQLFVVARAET